MSFKRSTSLLIISLLLTSLPLELCSFGFYAHRKINRMAVFTLPPAMLPFYRKHIEYLTEHSITPDKRAHAVPGEAPRHYIDIDHYGENPFDIMPRNMDDAINLLTYDTLKKYGILPWHIEITMQRLTKAFLEKNVDRILYYSAFIGHYIADASTPLHITKHYNGYLPHQKGIHALWETRLPELHAEDYNFFVGKADYIESPKNRAWSIIELSHNKVDTIFKVYDHLYKTMPADIIFSHEMRGQSFSRVYSRTFSEAFHNNMNGMVESQMQMAVKSVGDFWYSAWVNAGQPDIEKLAGIKITEQHKQLIKEQEEQWETIDEPLNREYSK